MRHVMALSTRDKAGEISIEVALFLAFFLGAILVGATAVSHAFTNILTKASMLAG